MSEHVRKLQIELDPACALLALLYRSCLGIDHSDVDADVALKLLGAAKAGGFNGGEELNERIAQALALAEQAVGLIDPDDMAAIMAAIDPNTLAPALPPQEREAVRPSFAQLVSEASEFLRSAGGLQRSDADIVAAIARLDAERELGSRGRVTAARIAAVLAARAEEYDRASVILQNLGIGPLSPHS